MLQLILAATLSGAALTSAQPSVKRQDASSVEWSECEFDWVAQGSNPFKLPIQCGTLEVPLDYTDDGNEETLRLDLVKIPATKEPILGSMLYNPGGPGTSGVEVCIANAQDLQIASGGQYDIGRTLPVKCSDGGAQESVEKRDGPLFSEDVMVVAERQWPLFQEIASNCSAALANTGQYYGTAFVARDMLQIVNALEEDGMLRYMGTSYGTLLGWTFAAMFPDRVDRMILDANVNPIQYWSGMDLDSLRDVDDLLKVILEGCFEAGDICPLAEYGDAQSVLDGLNTVFENWEPFPDPTEPSKQVELAAAKNQLVQPMYGPSKYFDLAVTIQKLLKMDPKEVIAATAGADKPKEQDPSKKWHQSDEFSIFAIRCSDWPLRLSDPSEMEGLISMLNMGSWADTSANDWTMCYSWPFEAKERYSGDFTAKTNHPILFVNPTWDPVTPLDSAQNSSSTMEGSVVLEHRAPGHSSWGLASACTAQHIRDYMVDGTLPEEGTVCEPDMPVFSNLTGIEFLLEKNKVFKALITDSNALDLEEAMANQANNTDGGDDGGDGDAANGSAEKNSASVLGASILAVAGVVGAVMAAI